MPPWLESHAELRDHPKTDLLMELLAVTRRDAVGLLHFVWWRALMYAPSGDLSDFTDGQIARWADWDGDPGHLVSALKTAGFLTSGRALHDWDEYAGRWIDRRKADADRKRDARHAAAGRVNGTHPGTSGGHPPGRRPESGVPDLTGPDLTGPDRTSTTPQPPPQAEGERKPTRRRRTDDEAQRVAVVAPPPEVPPLSPLAPTDAELWTMVREGLRHHMSPANWSQLIEPLEPLGRAADGGLYLRAPPGLGVGERALNHVRKALLDQGEERAQQSAIIESREARP